MIQKYWAIEVDNGMTWSDNETWIHTNNEGIYILFRSELDAIQEAGALEASNNDAENLEDPYNCTFTAVPFNFVVK